MRVAFVKLGGLGSGGIEKYLQTLACSLPKNKFDIDYYYTEGIRLINGWQEFHPGTDPIRKKYMEDNNINLIKIEADARDDRNGAPWPWVNTNFFDIFDEEKYDIVQTARLGCIDYPFYLMNKSTFVDSIHSLGNYGVEKRNNIKKWVLLSEFQAEHWIRNGGDSNKTVVIPPIILFPKEKSVSIRKDFNIEEDVFIFGMHQSNREDVFSDIPLNAYKQIESDKTAFMIMGGSSKYKEQTKQLNLKNVKFVDFSGDTNIMNNFISTIDVFTHGRADGEVCSAAIIEALYHGKPVITHPGYNMGHKYQIEGCGFMVNNVQEYYNTMKSLMDNKSLLEEMSEKSKNKYKEKFSLDVCINKYIEVYEGE